MSEGRGLAAVVAVATIGCRSPSGTGAPDASAMPAPSAASAASAAPRFAAAPDTRRVFVANHGKLVGAMSENSHHNCGSTGT
jgi:hypothetical protein